MEQVTFSVEFIARKQQNIDESFSDDLGKKFLKNETIPSLEKLGLGLDSVEYVTAYQQAEEHNRSQNKQKKINIRIPAFF